MNLTELALRRPVTILVLIVAVAMGAFLAAKRMQVDIFPSLNLPVIYVAQPYGGMDPGQMEGLLTNYYEYHFLYIGGIHHVESKNIQGVALMKLTFHPGTDMAQAMAETINYVNRSRAFMPPGTVSPFVMRFDTGSVPVGYLVLSSETRSLAEIQDLALFRVRPMFASLPGVSAPPPFGGSQRTVVINVNPDRLRACNLSPEEVVTALTNSNIISPSGNVHIGDKYPLVPINSIVKNVQEMGNIPVRMGSGPGVYLRDLGTIEDAMDLPSGYALVNGRRAIYILATKRADASTLSVVNEVRAALPKMQAALPDDIRVSFELDQSPYVTNSIKGLATEGILGAILTGLMVLLFLQDWRSALVVVLNIPVALMAAVIALWLTGQTVNLMTLGGLALAVGILVDEATVAIENIHTQFGKTSSVARAVHDGISQTAIPRFLAMICILAVFLPSFFMQGAARALFVPLSLAVGFSMLASYLLSSTFVPVVSTLLLRHAPHHDAPVHSQFSLARLRTTFESLLSPMLRLGSLPVLAYLVITGLMIVGVDSFLGMEIFPNVDAGQFRLRMRAADGTHFESTEKLALQALAIIKESVGPNNVDLTLGYVGTIPSTYPINAVFQWSRGPEEAMLRVSLKHRAGLSTEVVKEKLRDAFAKQMPGVRFSFEPADIVNEVMSFGSPTPLEIAVNGPSLAESRAHLEKVYRLLADIPSIRDLQISQSLDYPTVEVQLDRERAGLSSISPADAARSLVPVTSSSRFTVPNFWPDPKSGIGYQVQIQIPQRATTSISDLGNVPIKHAGGEMLLRDVSELVASSMPGQYDRYNMKREVSLTANIFGEDLGRVSQRVNQALAAAGEPPKGATINVRGQIPPMQEMVTGLGYGLVLAVVVIFLLLAANFQSLRLALITTSTAPAAITGVVLMLFLTRTTINIQSFVGAIMAIGVAMSNAILLVTFAEESRHAGASSQDAARLGATARLRPILMTSCAMLAGMLPLALGLGEGGDQSAPLGRAVIGGLLGATAATLLILPSVFSVVQRNATRRSASLDPNDQASDYYDRIKIDPRTT
jgi:multidrug efflux pump subunit AcrB